MMEPVLIAHGGVGARGEWSDGCVAACEAGWSSALDGQALEAVIRTAHVLEDDPRYNAGTGANLRLDGSCQLDAAVMDSAGNFGAVACVTGVRHPVDVARDVMLHTPHIMLCGEGATSFARMRGYPPYSPVTERAMKKLERRRKDLAQSSLAKLWDTAHFTGTIGAVARTASGDFAVSCSTGGTSLMLPGRIGDSPICGAGVFAGPLGAICCTGDGEVIMTRLVAHRIYMALEQGASLEELCRAEIERVKDGVYLGIIAVSHEQQCALSTHDMPCDIYSG